MSHGDHELFTAVHSVFSLCRGLACLSNGPIGTALVTAGPATDLAAFGIAKYMYLVVYATGMPCLSGTLILLRMAVNRVRNNPDSP
jgi:hypothetical protein